MVSSSMVSLSACLVKTECIVPTDFWRDEAKLSILDEHKRSMWFLGMLGGMILIVLLYNFGFYIGLQEMWSRTIAACATIILLPAVIALDLFYKGRSAGNRLIAERDELREKATAVSERQSQLMDRFDSGKAAIEGLRQAVRGDDPSAALETANAVASEWGNQIVEWAREFRPDLYGAIVDARQCRQKLDIGKGEKNAHAGMVQAVCDVLSTALRTK